MNNFGAIMKLIFNIDGVIMEAVGEPCGNEGDIMIEQEFAQAVADAGGRAYVVGGWVRDTLRGQEAHDKDYVVTGFSRENFGKAFPEAKLVGQAFPVFLLKIEESHCEVALARQEQKQGSGYRGFVVEAGADITIEEDLYRRDLTVNSMAMDILTGEIIDPYNGREDLKEGILRQVSEHFGEDPVRALRAARFSARLGYLPAPQLIAAMRQCREELKQEPAERILGELHRALETSKPAAFFQMLKVAGLLDVVFPEIYDLIGKSQPEAYHPEGDAFEHSMLMLSRVADRTGSVVARFCALCHDLGKGTTPEEMLPHHYGHEQRGIEVLQHWNHHMTLPNTWLRAAKFVISQHMRAPRLSKPGKICDLLLAMDAAAGDLPVEDFKYIVEADHHGLPDYMAHAQEGIDLLKSISGKDAPKTLSGRKIGEWVYERQQMLCRQWLDELRN